MVLGGQFQAKKIDVVDDSDADNIILRAKLNATKVQINGGDGNDTINASPLTIQGSGGNDTITGGSNDDLPMGGAGDDQIDDDDGNTVSAGNALLIINYINARTGDGELASTNGYVAAGYIDVDGDEPRSAATY